MDMLGFVLIPGTIENPLLFIVLGSLSAILVSTAKAGFGGSIGILSFPILLYACGGRAYLAAGVMLPLLITCDLVAVASWWGKWRARPVRLLLGGAVLGIAAGGVALWALRRLDGPAAAQAGRANAALTLAIGLIAILFVVLRGLGALRRRPPAFRPVLWQGALFGAAGGFTSTLAHAAGPIITMYMLPQQLDKGTYVASTVLYYWLNNLIKLLPYFLLGMINTETLGAGLLLVPAVLVGTLSGLALHHRLGQRQFEGIVYALLALAGIHLSIKGAESIWL